MMGWDGMGWDDRAAADASGRGLGVEPEAHCQTELISSEPEIAFFFNFYFVSKVQFDKIYINTNSVKKRQNWPLDTVNVWYLLQATTKTCLCCDTL